MLLDYTKKVQPLGVLLELESFNCTTGKNTEEIRWTT